MTNHVKCELHKITSLNVVIAIFLAACEAHNLSR